MISDIERGRNQMTLERLDRAPAAAECSSLGLFFWAVLLGCSFGCSFCPGAGLSIGEIELCLGVVYL